MDKIKVLVVDDSTFMRKVITDMLNSDPQITVIGTASDGRETIEKVKTLTPDVITLDIIMPEMDGLSALEHIMKQYPTPVVMFSKVTRDGAEATLKALECGAVDFVTKPQDADLGSIKIEFDKIKAELIDKIKIAARIDRHKLKILYPTSRIVEQVSTVAEPTDHCICIGSSAGGPKVLMEIIPQFPEELESGILVAQHMPSFFIKSFTERLSNTSKINVREAKIGDIVTPATAFLAPESFTIKVEKIKRGGAITLSSESSVHRVKPCIDSMMEAAALVYGAQTIGVLLSGMGRDGVKGLKTIKQAGGKTMAQDESSSIVFGMAKAAIEEGVVDIVAPAQRIVEEILKLI